MTTTDSNGLIQYQTTDNVVPLQTTLNAISSSVSTSLNSTVRTFKVASDTERNALATSRPPTATNPLVVFNSASGKGYHEINTGSGWSRWIPANGVSSSIPSQMIQSGKIMVTTSTGTNSVGSVTFPIAFSSAPTVQITAETSNPGAYSWAVVNATTSSFSVRVASSSNTSVAIHWMAMGTR